MSPQSSSNQPVQKQKTNVYTMMLILAFLAVLVACVLLWMELQLYGDYPWWKPSVGGGAATSQIYQPPLASGPSQLV